MPGVKAGECGGEEDEVEPAEAEGGDGYGVFDVGCICAVEDFDADFLDGEVAADEAADDGGDGGGEAGTECVGAEIGGGGAVGGETEGDVGGAEIESCGGDAADDVDEDEEGNGEVVALRHGGEGVEEQDDDEEGDGDGEDAFVAEVIRYAPPYFEEVDVGDL